MFWYEFLQLPLSKLHPFPHLPCFFFQVFDFGSEVYIWNGRNAPFETRRLGVKLATDLWQNTSINGHPCETKGPRRPEWCLSGKVNEVT